MIAELIALLAALRPNRRLQQSIEILVQLHQLSCAYEYWKGSLRTGPRSLRADTSSWRGLDASMDPH